MTELYDRILSYVRGRQRAYRLTFPLNPAQIMVLADLAKFCRAFETTFHADPRVHAALEGRREVWLRVTNHLHLTAEQLVVIYNQTKETI